MKELECQDVNSAQNALKEVSFFLCLVSFKKKYYKSGLPLLFKTNQFDLTA
jgi:hypothetical protein